MKYKSFILTLFIALIVLISSTAIIGLTGYEYLSNYTVAYYTFDNSTNVSLVNTNYNYTENSITRITGILGNASSSNGVGNINLTRTLIPTGTTGTANWCVNFWYNKNTDKNNSAIIDTYGNPTAFTPYARLLFNSNTSIFSESYDGTNNPSSYGQVLNKNQWYMLTWCWQRDGPDTQYLFINGNLSINISSTAQTNFGSLQTNNAFTLNKMWGGDNVANATFDEFSFYNKTLTKQEIEFLWSNATPSLNQRYPFIDVINAPIPEFTFISQNPINITNTNLFNFGNITIEYNITKPNINYSYLNYTTNTTTGYIELSNGTVTRSGYSQSNSSFNTSVFFNYSLFADNGVYPTNYWGYNQNVFSSTTHQFYTSSSVNNYLKLAVYNMSTFNVSILELNLNSTGNTRVIYCNSSYVNGNPLINANCVHFFTLANVQTFNHSHGPLSSHNLIPLPINNTGFLSGIKVSSNGFFLVNAQTGNLQIGYINNTTRPDTTQTSTNTGASYTNLAGTIDGHLHQQNDSLDTFNYQSCAVNSTNTSCSSFRSYNIGITSFAPSNPEIIYPNINGLNISTEMINISWIASGLNGATSLNNYTIYLLNSDFSLNRTIGNTSQTSIVFDFYSNNIRLGQYMIKVNVTDNLNNVAEDIGEPFNLIYDGLLNITAKNYFSNSTITGFNITINDLNGTDYRTFVTTGTFINVSIIIGHSYNVSADNSDYAIAYSTITPINSFTNYTFFLNRTNSVYLLAYDTGTNLLINTTQVNFTFVSNTTTYIFSTNNGTYLAFNLTTDIYTVTVNADQYATTSYTITINPDSSQQLNAYLLRINNSNFIQFYIKDLATHAVSNATINVQRLVNSTYVQIGNKQTDILGFTYFFLESGVNYKFTITADGFETRNYFMETFLVNSPYVIKITPLSQNVFVDIFSEVSYSVSPLNTTLYPILTTFSIQSSSPNGKMLYTYINCNGLSQNISGQPNGATAQVNILPIAGQIIICNYSLAVDGFDVYSFTRNYNTNINQFLNTNTSLYKSMQNFATTYEQGMYTILAFIIIIFFGAMSLEITGSSTVSTFLVFIGIIFFGFMGWMDIMMSLFIGMLAGLYYFLTSRGR